MFAVLQPQLDNTIHTELRDHLFDLLPFSSSISSPISSFQGLQSEVPEIDPAAAAFTPWGKVVRGKYSQQVRLPQRDYLTQATAEDR
jgi:hypothetical protein